MHLDTLPFSPDWRAAPAWVAALFDAAEEASRSFTARGSEQRVPSLVCTSAAAAWSVLSAARAQLPLADDTFIEWGCGNAAVACLAARLGWRSTGIDNAAPMVAAMQDFATAHGVQLHVGDYRPDAPPDDRLFAAGLVYAYAWPQEARWLPQRFARDARPGQILLMYEGGSHVRAYRAREGPAP